MKSNLRYLGLEVVTLDEARKTLELSARDYCSNAATKFIQANEYGAYLMENTWLLLIAEYSRLGANAIRDWLLRDGIFSVISSIQSDCQAVYDGGLPTSSLWLAIFEDVKFVLSTTGGQRAIPDHVNDPRAVLLTLMRYPKRFTVQKADFLENRSLAAFRAREEKNAKVAESLDDHWYLIRELRDFAREIVDWKKLVKGCKDVLANPFDYVISPGSTTVGTDFYQKLKWIAHNSASSSIERLQYPFGSEFITSSYYQRVLTDDNEETAIWLVNDVVARIVKKQYGIRNSRDSALVYAEHQVPSYILCVPKDYKGYRIIAKEPPLRAAKSIAVGKRLEELLLCDELPLTNQEVNVKLAQLGSRDGSYGTGDLSSASDSIPKATAAEVFDYDFYCLIESVLPKYISYDKGNTRTLLHCLSTSGNGVTFRTLALFVWIIVKYAMAMMRLWKAPMSGDKCSIYGDDFIAPSECLPLILDIFYALGFDFNPIKTYYTGLFRESCGGDFYAGDCVSSVYWPRKKITGKNMQQILEQKDSERDKDGELNTAFASLVSLQQRLFYISRSASAFLLEELQKGIPSLTFATPGTTGLEPWSYMETSIKSYSPYASIILNDDGKRQLVAHASITQSYLDSKKVFAVESKPSYSGDSDFVEAYLYTLYLKEGPFYGDALSELLGVSTSRRQSLWGKPIGKAVVMPK